MDNYDPNLHFCVHTAEVTFQHFAYKRTISVCVRGNCKGFSIMETAKDYAIDKMCESIEDDGYVIFENGDKQLMIDRSSCDEDDFEKMIVSVRIISVEKENRREAKPDPL